MALTIMRPPLRLAVLLSGNGTTLQNLLDRLADGRLQAEIVLVVSNRMDAYGLTRAEQAGVPTAVVQARDFASREEFSRSLFDLCRRAGVELVCLAGFLQLIHMPNQRNHYLGLQLHPLFSEFLRCFQDCACLHHVDLRVKQA